MQDFTSVAQFFVPIAVAAPFVILFFIFFIGWERQRKKLEDCKRKINAMEDEISNYLHAAHINDEREITAKQREANRHADLKAALYKTHLLINVLVLVHPYSRLLVHNDKKLEAYLRKLKEPKPKKKAVKHLEIDRSKL